MVRGKTQLKRIENTTSRQATFSKRRKGLLKKASELSVLCDADVALIIFSPRGKLNQYASSSMEETIGRYKRHVKNTQDSTSPFVDQNAQPLKHEAQRMSKKIEQLETSKRKLLGEDLGKCSIRGLRKIERQLDRSISIIRARKTSLYRKLIEQLKEKERILVAENAMLREKLRLDQHQISNEDNAAVSIVETALSIGLPDQILNYTLFLQQ
ncbi:MADS-box protein SOC1-like isoform X2 [Primulina eburnea]|uniref:MADS-box protein SOC1-like isoform X2 n=1 Tax=Primulina eburnea TaxID=1245227 RepID=UPI003C6C7661